MEQIIILKDGSRISLFDLVRKVENLEERIKELEPGTFEFQSLAKGQTVPLKPAGSIESPYKLMERYQLQLGESFDKDLSREVLTKMRAEKPYSFELLRRIILEVDKASGTASQEMGLNKRELEIVYEFATSLSGGYWDAKEEHLEFLEKVMKELKIVDPETNGRFKNDHMHGGVR